MKSNPTHQQKIMITVGAALLVAGLAWFGIKHQSSVFTVKSPQIFSEEELAANPIMDTTGVVLGEQENSSSPTNPLEGIYVNPFAE